jgi:hypothetical protein
MAAVTSCENALQGVPKKTQNLDRDVPDPDTGKI